MKNHLRDTLRGKLMPSVCAGVLLISGLGLGGCYVGPNGAAVYAPTPGYVGIAVEDRPYYLHGASYRSGRSYYVWRAGHWRRHRGHRVWVHGGYVVR